ncbi:hypothetical protein [Sinosporangium siamense]|uniref:Uncharacterized protein n=1 Tax=Sinosporangium siamense TaxID=1367973 RepID=A0A919RDH3_9ACTN|nr:hypothetical protein [Sinosporangium siamense]GII89831.1 hypothetical protein Ssi02_00620 [Sinosporangium siamense]
MKDHHKKIAIDYADFAAYDRAQRAILRHLLAAFAGGLLVGIVGWFVHTVDLVPIQEVFDPYAYYALAVIVGMTASGVGWAMLAGLLAALAPLVSTMGGLALTGQWNFDSVGGSALGLNFILLVLFLFALLAYASRRIDVWGDVAVGLIAGLVLADIVDRATPGLIARSGAGFWPLPAALVGVVAVAMVFVLRRRLVARARALGVAATTAGVAALPLAL